MYGPLADHLYQCTPRCMNYFDLWHSPTIKCVGLWLQIGCLFLLPEDKTVKLFEGTDLVTIVVMYVP